MNKFFTILLCVCCMLVSSCDEKKSDNQSVMVVLKNPISYWESVESGVNRACDELNITGDIRWTLADGDSASQIEAITEYKSHLSEYSGLVIAPANKAVCDFLAETLNEDATPLVILDTPSSEESDLKYNVYVGTDNYQAGVDLANKALLENPDIKTQEVYIFRLPNTKSVKERADGIKSVITNATIVVLEENEEKAIEEISTTAASADVVFGANMICLTYVAKAVYEKELPSLDVYGFDDSDYINARIEDGTIKGVMVQNSEEMGYMSVKAVMTTNHGKTNESEYLSTEYKTKL